jgi:methionyl-tRNA formyltransferase
VLKNREKTTGLTCHYMDEGVDTGAIIHQVAVPVEPRDTIGDVIDRQKQVLAGLIIESLSRLQDVHFRAVVQDSSAATFAPKPKSGE